MIYYISNDNIRRSDNIRPTTIDEAIGILSRYNYVGWDTETTGLTPFYDKPILNILGNEDNQVVVDLRTTRKEDIAILHDALKNHTWIAHNAKFDYKMFFWHYPTVFIGTCWDTEVAARILYNRFNIGGFGLANLSHKFLNIKRDKSQRNTFINKADTEPFTDEEIVYAAEDTAYLNAIMQAELGKDAVNNFGYKKNGLFDMEMRFTRELARMENVGFNFDSYKWKNLADRGKDLLSDTLIELDTELNRLSKTYRKLISAGLSKVRYVGCNEKEYNNYGSNDTLYKIFLCTDEVANLPVRDDLKDAQEAAQKAALNRKRKKEKSRGNVITFSNGKKAVQQSLFDVLSTTVELKPSAMYKYGENDLKNYLKKDTEAKSPLRTFIKLLLKFRGEVKDVSTYGEKFLSTLSVGGRARTSYNQVFTSTGRLSSSKYSIKTDAKGKDIKEGYNAQNIPKVLEMRHCFMAEAGYKIATIDFSGQEIALAAAQSKDPILIKSRLEGLDLHSYLAQGTFRIITGDDTLIVSSTVNKHLRNKHKPILFGLFYGATATRIAAELDIPLTLAEKVYANIKGLLPDFFAYQSKVQSNATNNRWVHDHCKFGRRRYFDSTVPSWSIKTKAANFPMQSSGASMVKEAIIAVSDYLEQYKATYPHIQVLGTVHDELIIQIPEDRRDIAEECARIMETVGETYLDGLPIEATIEWEDYWTK